MAIKRPAELDFSDKKFSMIIAAAPGTGKTTLALSAPNPILVDFDRGISRVQACHRKLTDVVDTYEELLKDMESKEFQECETVILDTGGSFVTYLQDYVMRKDPSIYKQKSSNSVSLKGFGAVKTEFVSFTNRLKDVLKKNVIYIFHTQEEKAKDGSIVQRLLCEGAVRNIVWQPCDLGAYMQIVNGKRQLCFSPTEEYFAKGCHGINGIIEVPDLDKDSKNDFLTRLFESAKRNIIEESKIFDGEKEKYEAAMERAKEIIEKIVDKDTANQAKALYQQIEHALTSKKESGVLFQAKVKELGLTYNKEAEQYA